MPDYFAALYFRITTLTTVWFEDVVTITPWGQAVMSTAILVGMAVIPAQASTLLDAILEFQNEWKLEKEMELIRETEPPLASSQGLTPALETNTVEELPNPV